jgi:hypothetical protein
MEKVPHNRAARLLVDKSNQLYLLQPKEYSRVVYSRLNYKLEMVHLLNLKIILYLTLRMYLVKILKEITVI